MTTFAADLKFGEENEAKMLAALEGGVGATLTRQGGYSVWDYFGDKVRVELKTRRNTHSAFPTTMVGFNKVQACRDPETAYWFAFAFTDGLYAIRYDKALFDTFEVKTFQRWGRADHYDKPLPYCYIPIEHLIRVPQ